MQVTTFQGTRYDDLSAPSRFPPTGRLTVNQGF